MSAADGFQMSWKASAGNDMHISGIAIAVASISGRPPRRRARATVARTAAKLTIPIVTAIHTGSPSRAGSASSQ